MRKFLTCVLMACLWGAAAPRVRSAPRDDVQEGARLDRTWPEIKFEKNALKDVIDFVRDVSGASFYVDWTALAAAGVKPESTVSVHLHEARFHGVLDYAIEDGVITISTKQDFDSQVIVRKYPLADLPAFGSIAHTLENRVRREVDPGSWDGPGNVEIVDGEFVVTATLENQQKVEKMLEEMTKMSGK